MRIQLPSKKTEKNAMVSFSHRFSAEVDDTPSVAESDVSSVDSSLVDNCYEVQVAVPPRKRLEWEFHGLTLWVEYEEFDFDLTRALDHAVSSYGTERIPLAHSTAAYGMTHLSDEEAISKLQQVSGLFPGGWPSIMESPVAIKQDIAQVGRPGQVCNIAWAELTCKTNEEHEEAIDKLHNLFEIPTPRQHPWTPHISLAYDNPEDTILTLFDTVSYVSKNPSLMRPRRIRAVSLWSTRGKLGEFYCLSRVHL